MTAQANAMAPADRKTISIVTPCYNEEAGIRTCRDEVRALIEAQLPQYNYEHIFIDNGSTDRTPAILRELASADPRVKVILNARNFGVARSSFHAITSARGDVVIPMMADLQTPPSLVPAMVALWEGGARVVIAVRRRSGEGAAMATLRTLFYRIMRNVSKVEQVPNFMGYGAFDQVAIAALRQLKEPEPFFRGLIMEVGFERAFIEYDQPPRRTGRSSYTIASLADYAILGLSTYSRAPLRIMTAVGFVVACLSLLVGLGYLVAKLLFWSSFPLGVAPLVIAVFFLGAVQLFAIGIVGEYVGLLLNYARQFPLVVEKERMNFD